MHFSHLRYKHSLHLVKLRLGFNNVLYAHEPQLLYTAESLVSFEKLTVLDIHHVAKVDFISKLVPGEKRPRGVHNKLGQQFVLGAMPNTIIARKIEVVVAEAG